MNQPQKCLLSLLSFTIATTLILGYNHQANVVLASPQMHTKANAKMPTLAETKAIAEAGFIYGLPIVMNYGVMYEYAVDKNSGQFKAPFNQIKNEARVFTYKDTAIVTANSDTPYSFAWLDLRTEPIILSVPAFNKDRYHSIQLEDGNTFIFGYVSNRATGNEAGDYMVVGPTGKEKNHQASKRFFAPPPNLR